MNQIKTHRDKNFLVINKTALNDERLSWGAKGLHSYLMGLREDWKIYESDLVNRSTEGKTFVKKFIKELIDNGYMTRERKRNEKGHLAHYEYDLYEIPRTVSPTLVSPTLVSPTLVKQSLINNDLNKDLNKEILTRDKDIVEIVDYLNGKVGSKYSNESQKTNTLIKARVKDGFSVDDFKQVIDIKTTEWLNTHMATYLRPETLFGTKFESYLNQKGVQTNAGTANKQRDTSWTDKYDFSKRN